MSHIGRARWQYPRLIAQLQAAAAPTSSAVRAGASSTAVALTSTGASAAESAVGTMVKTAKQTHEGTWSLGSSGAVYALFALTALGFPDAEITLVIPPWFPINIQTGFFTLLAFDTLGVLRGWRSVFPVASTVPLLTSTCLQDLRPLGPSWWRVVRDVLVQVRRGDLVLSASVGPPDRVLPPRAWNEVEDKRQQF